MLTRLFFGTVHFCPLSYDAVKAHVRVLWLKALTRLFVCVIRFCQLSYDTVIWQIRVFYDRKSDQTVVRVFHFCELPSCEDPRFFVRNGWPDCCFIRVLFFLPAVIRHRQMIGVLELFFFNFLIARWITQSKKQESIRQYQTTEARSNFKSIGNHK